MPVEAVYLQQVKDHGYLVTIMFVAIHRSCTESTGRNIKSHTQKERKVLKEVKGLDRPIHVNKQIKQI